MYACGCPFSRLLLCHSNARQQLHVSGEPAWSANQATGKCWKELSIGRQSRKECTRLTPMKRFYYETAILRSGRCRINMEVGEFSKRLHQYFHQGQAVKRSQHARKGQPMQFSSAHIPVV